MNIEKLILVWQNPETRTWFPIGMLIFDGEYYRFNYTKGVEKALAENFQLLHCFPKKLNVYRSKKIFPIFANRLMPSSRPDYHNYLHWLNLSEDEDHLMNILARSGGIKVTDTFQIFRIPTKNDDGIFEINFFVHGLRYMPPSSQECVTSLEANTQLLITKDCQNQYDVNALSLKTKDNHNLGYIPRYLTKDIIKLLDRDSQSVKVYVKKVNPPPAPIQLRLLCNLTAPWYGDFTPFSDEDYQYIFKDDYPCLVLH